MTYELESHWMNYRTGQWETQPQGFILTATDEQALDYIPQDPSAKGMFRCLREMGKSVPDTMIYVLEACAGIEHSSTTPSAQGGKGRSNE